MGKISVAYNDKIENLQWGVDANQKKITRIFI